MNVAVAPQLFCSRSIRSPSRSSARRCPRSSRGKPARALIRASYSTNIKERRDCSTALFNVEGHTLLPSRGTSRSISAVFIGIVPQILEAACGRRHASRRPVLRRQ